MTGFTNLSSLLFQFVNATGPIRRLSVCQYVSYLSVGFYNTAHVFGSSLLRVAVCAGGSGGAGSGDPLTHPSHFSLRATVIPLIFWGGPYLHSEHSEFGTKNLAHAGTISIVVMCMWGSI